MDKGLILAFSKGRAISSKNGKNVGNGQSYLPIDFYVHASTAHALTCTHLCQSLFFTYGNKH